MVRDRREVGNADRAEPDASLQATDRVGPKLRTEAATWWRLTHKRRSSESCCADALPPRSPLTSDCGKKDGVPINRDVVIAHLSALNERDDR
jgi:hypothetical protein